MESAREHTTRPLMRSGQHSPLLLRNVDASDSEWNPIKVLILSQRVVKVEALVRQAASTQPTYSVGHVQRKLVTLSPIQEISQIVIAHLLQLILFGI